MWTQLPDRHRCPRHQGHSRDEGTFRPSTTAVFVPSVEAWIFTPTLEHYTSVLSGGSGTSVGFDRLLFNSR